jgi:hypothetical protein
MACQPRIGDDLSLDVGNCLHELCLGTVWPSGSRPKAHQEENPQARVEANSLARARGARKSCNLGRNQFPRIPGIEPRFVRDSLAPIPPTPSAR